MLSIKNIINIILVLLSLLAIGGYNYYINNIAPDYGVSQITYYDNKNIIEYDTYDGYYELKPVADYEVDAQIILKKGYFNEPQGDIMPYDLVLGWDIMKHRKNLTGIDFWQKGRWYYFQYKHKDIVVSGNDIGLYTANTHSIPASEEVYEKMKELKIGDVVKIKGKLVDIYMKDGGLIRSSRVRTDSGGGACEVMYIEEIEPINN